MTADHTGTGPAGRRAWASAWASRSARASATRRSPGSVGEYGWAGNAGTLFWIDPKEQLIAIYMVQVSDPDRVELRNRFRTMVQAAIID